MRIVVNHLTRMAEGYICVAGIERDTGQHVRPVQAGRLGNHLLARNGGPFDVACQIDLGAVQHVGAAPEVEDYRFGPYALRQEGICPRDAFWALLERAARRGLGEIFGPDLRQDGLRCSVERGKGRASLGCLVPSGAPTLAIDEHGTIRLRFSDGERSVAPSVTDIRLYGDDHVTPDPAIVAGIAERLARGVPVILGVGLTRLWQKPGDADARHWLQVNNLHLADDPCWQLG